MELLIGAPRGPQQKPQAWVGDDVGGGEVRACHPDAAFRISFQLVNRLRSSKHLHEIPDLRRARFRSGFRFASMQIPERNAEISSHKELTSIFGFSNATFARSHQTNADSGIDLRSQSFE